MQARANQQSLLSRYESVRIIGQGLAGSLLALQLKELEIPFVVQDIPRPGCATSVAPGIVNPLAGRNFSPPKYIDDLFEQLHVAMGMVENALGESIWTPCPILRMFSDPTQIDRLESSLQKKESTEYVSDRREANSYSYLNDDFGSFVTEQAGWANLPIFKSRMRKMLDESGLLIEEEWTPDYQPSSKGRELVVFCEGWHSENNPIWSFIPHNPAKGEMIVVRFEEPIPRDRIYNQSCWVQPIGEDSWRVGATYSWSAFDSEPTLDGAEKLQENLSLLTSVPFHVEDQIAGVRPIVDDYKPVVGQHPENKDWFILNAMGSKGVLQTPTAVKDLVDHLVEGSRIPSEWSVDRFS
ncbi:MAG: NAD(P)/FAD-dependent oxidoreductase [Puniceicoccaceae bacterium]